MAAKVNKKEEKQETTQVVIKKDETLKDNLIFGRKVALTVLSCIPPAIALAASVIDLMASKNELEKDVRKINKNM